MENVNIRPYWIHDTNKLWSNSYYAGTVGNMSKETVNQYILNQYTGKELAHSSLK